MANLEKIIVLLKRATCWTLPALRHDATADVTNVICGKKKKHKNYGQQKIDPRLYGAVSCIA